MKYLNTFCVYSKELMEETSYRIKIIEHMESDTRLLLNEFETYFHNALLDFHKSEEIVYYKSFMDGWNNTSMIISNWFESSGLFLSKEFLSKWNLYREKGVLFFSFDDLHILPVTRNLKKNSLKQVSGFGDYAALAFLMSLNDAMEFVDATHSQCVILSRAVGASVSDEEYMEKNNG